MGKLYRRKGSEDKLIVVATDEEYKLAKKRFKHRIIIKTGVGGINVVRKLKRLPKWLKITNFGYVGSNNIPIGTEIRVGESRLYHPNVIYNEQEYTLDKESTIKCFTSNDFVLETNIKKPCVFDMELAYICALGFKRVESIKIVSDNLSLKQYEEEIK
jgi:hypothetical protein